METALLECQYADGAFSYQYGAETSFDDRDWQTTAYAIFTLWDHMAHTSTNLTSIYDAAAWLASTQDASGGWVYTSGNHYPEIGGEAAAAVAYGWCAAGAVLNTTANRSGPRPVRRDQDRDFQLRPGRRHPRPLRLRGGPADHRPGGHRGLRVTSA